VEPMALDHDHPVVEAPRPFAQPTDAPAPLRRSGDRDPLRSLRAILEAEIASRTGSLRQRARAWASRTSGRSERRLLAALAAATESLAGSCDELVDRVTRLERVTADVSGALGEELTRLRAEVGHLRHLVDSPHGG
jgi:hypothetical protein